MAEDSTPSETAVLVKTTEENTKSNPKPNPKGAEVSEEKMKDKDKAAGLKRLEGVLSLITMVLSLPMLASVIWLLYMKYYDCEKLLRLPPLQIGISVGIIFVFLISNIVVLVRSKVPVIGFFAVMVPLLVFLTMGLALIGAYKLESRSILATPRWFREKIHNDNNWKNIKACLYGTHACDDLALRLTYNFNLKKLNSIESGCCKPPDICGMEYVNATYWKKGDHGAHIRDCDTWSNKEQSLCYDCDACRDGFVMTMENKWSKLGLFLTLMSLFLIVSHLVLFIVVMLERYNKKE